MATSVLFRTDITRYNGELRQNKENGLEQDVMGNEYQLLALITY